MIQTLLLLAMLQMGSGGDTGVVSTKHGVWLSWQTSPSAVIEMAFNRPVGTVSVNRATGDCTTNGGFAVLATGVDAVGPYYDASAVSGTTYAYTVDYIDNAYATPDSGPSNCTSVTAP